MPGFDSSGPMGAGPMTGGGRGLCNPANRGSRIQPAGSFGFGRGMGLGRGFRGGYGRGMRGAPGMGRWNTSPYYPTYLKDSTEELDMLKTEAASVKNTLNRINRRIAELEKSSE